MPTPKDGLYAGETGSMLRTFADTPTESAAFSGRASFMPSSLLLSLVSPSLDTAFAFIKGQWPFFSLYRIARNARMTTNQ